jgi:ABC-type transporter Mla subunit MlaD
MNFDQNKIEKYRFLTTLMWGILFFVLLALSISYLKGYFSKPINFKITTEFTSDLREGIKVTYKGFKLGTLSQLKLNTNGNVDAFITIDESYKEFFREGVKLKISKDKIVTTELVLVELHQDGSLLPPNSLVEVINENMTTDVTKKVEPLLNKISILLDQLADPKLGLQATLTRSREAMNQTSHLISTLSDEEKGLPPVLNETKQTMSSLRPVTSEAVKTLKEFGNTAVKVQDDLDQVKQLLDQLLDPKDGIKQTMTQTQTVIDKTDQLLENVDQVVTDVTNAPIYKFLVPTKK